MIGNKAGGIRLGRTAVVAVVGALLAISSKCAFAQDQSEESRGVQIGAFSFEPELGLGLRYNDNIFTTPSSEEDSWITVQAVDLLFFIEPGANRFELEYNGDFAQYLDSSDDDYEDHKIAGRGLLNIGRKGLLDVETSFANRHEDRGSGLTEGLGPESPFFPDSPDQYDVVRVFGDYTYGSKDAPAQLQFEAGYRDREYQNHRDRTRFFDRDDAYVGGGFAYRVRPRTSAVVDARFTDIDYDETRTLEPQLDSNEYLYQVGVTWEKTAKTRGVVKVGYLSKDFDDSGRDDFSGFSWEVNIRWSPRTYSHFDLQTARETSEATDFVTDYIESRWVSLGWTHDWSRGWESMLELGYRDEDYEGSERNEDLTWFNMRLSYQMRRWLTWQIGADIGSQDSSIDRFEFDETVFLIGAKMTL